MMRLIAFILYVLTLSYSASAHDPAVLPDEPDLDRHISFPDTAGYVTLVLDPHTHSVFSDGHVWPRIRVEEALRDGLDAIAITEHLEWQPHLSDIPHPDRNRAYETALESADEHMVMVVPGAEITRSSDAGHINALFISDANALIGQIQATEPFDVMAYYQQTHAFPVQQAVDNAAQQGAFLFWNHPWYGDEWEDSIPAVSEFHRKNIAAGKIKGIEVANMHWFSEEAFQIAIDNDLTMIGTSDVHDLIDWDYPPHRGEHRPVTLVLAQEATMASMQEALEAGRTLVWFKNTLAARETEMRTMLDASLTVSNVRYEGEKNLLRLEIRNHSDVDFQLKNLSPYTFSRNAELITVEQHSELPLILKMSEKIDALELSFEVLNALTAPRTPFVLQWQLVVDGVN